MATAETLVTVVSPGVQTTVQDVDGRCGLWDVGVPPSGGILVAKRSIWVVGPSDPVTGSPARVANTWPPAMHGLPLNAGNSAAPTLISGPRVRTSASMALRTTW